MNEKHFEKIKTAGEKYTIYEENLIGFVRLVQQQEWQLNTQNSLRKK